MKEFLSSQEKSLIKDESVIEILRAKGFLDTEARQLLLGWVSEREAEVAKANNSMAAIEFEIRRIKLYFDAGYKDEALELLNDMAEVNEPELIGQIESLRSSLEK